METKIFESIKNILLSSNIDIETLELRDNKTNFVVYYFNSLVCSIKISQKLKCISFDTKHISLFDKSFNLSQIASDLSHFRVNINSVSDIDKMSQQIIEIFSSLTVPVTFDICSRYMECSNQKRCIHPDKQHSRECSYRRKLESGIIFYGSNRNV